MGDDRRAVRGMVARFRALPLADRRLFLEALPIVWVTRLGLWLVPFRILQDVLSSSSPQFWMLWMGIFLVALALVGRERLTLGVRGLVAKVVR